jgi:hypothetical protein
VADGRSLAPAVAASATGSTNFSWSKLGADNKLKVVEPRSLGRNFENAPRALRCSANPRCRTSASPQGHSCPPTSNRTAQNRATAGSSQILRVSRDKVESYSRLHVSPFSLKLAGRALLPLYVAWKPKAVLPPLARLAFQLALRTVTFLPTCVAEPFQVFVRRWLPPNVQASCQPVSGTPV